jgi:3'-phosphoadenosine 5'-phosphosulfate sulfotransferase (PAPS reductase)/FAD synthetase
VPFLDRYRRISSILVGLRCVNQKERGSKAPVSSDQLSRRKMAVSVDKGSIRAPSLRENADAVSQTIWLWNVPVNMASRPGTVVRKS